jgi:hypothetical protein
MQVFLDIIKEENLVELSASAQERCIVVFSINDDDGRRIFKSSIMEKGKVKIYSRVDDAVKDALRKLLPHSERSEPDLSISYPGNKEL